MKNKKYLGLFVATFIVSFLISQNSYFVSLFGVDLSNLYQEFFALIGDKSIQQIQPIQTIITSPTTTTSPTIQIDPNLSAPSITTSPTATTTQTTSTTTPTTATELTTTTATTTTPTTTTAPITTATTTSTPTTTTQPQPTQSSITTNEQIINTDISSQSGFVQNVNNSTPTSTQINQSQPSSNTTVPTVTDVLSNPQNPTNIQSPTTQINQNPNLIDQNNIRPTESTVLDKNQPTEKSDTLLPVINKEAPKTEQQPQTEIKKDSKIKPKTRKQKETKLSGFLNNDQKCFRGELIKNFKKAKSSTQDKFNIILSHQRKNVSKLGDIIRKFLREKGLPFRQYKTLIHGFSIRQISLKEIGELLKEIRKNGINTDDVQTDIDPENEEAKIDSCPFYLEPDVKLRRNTDTSVEYIKATEVHQKLNITGKGVVVAVLDTGMNIDHEGLKDKIKDSIDYTGEGIIDQNGHGTHVGFIVAGSGYFYQGVAPGAELLNVKTTDQNGEGNMSDTVAGLEWSIDHGADIANLSLGALIDKCDGTDALSRAVDSANDLGLLVVAAAGNFGPDPRTISTPGCAKKALTVGAVDETGRVADFSSRGPTSDGRTKPNIFAAGVQIASGWYDAPDSYVIIDGTSQASPHVAGVAALLLEANPEMTADQIKSTFLANVDPLSESYPDLQNHEGIIDAYKIVSMYESPQVEQETLPKQEDEVTPDEPVTQPIEEKDDEEEEQEEDKKPSSDTQPQETKDETPETIPESKEEPISSETPKDTVAVQESDVIEDTAQIDESYTIVDKAKKIADLTEAISNLESCVLRAKDNADQKKECNQIYLDSQIKFKKESLLSQADKELSAKIDNQAITLGQVGSKLKESAKNNIRAIAEGLKKTVFVAENAQSISVKTKEIVEKINQGTITQREIGDYENFIESIKTKNIEDKYKQNLIPFKDVDDNKWSFFFIDKIKKLKIISGYKDSQGKATGDFGATNFATIAESLKMSLESSGNYQSESKDDPKNPKVKTHWARGYFLRAEELGLNIVKNTNDDPNRPITRQEFVQLQLEVLEVTPLKSFDQIFSDVDKKSAFAGYIYRAFGDGVISGDAGKPTFRPFDKITREEIAKVLVLALQKYKSL